MHHTGRPQPTDIHTQAAASIDGSDPLGPKIDTSGDGLARGSPGTTGGWALCDATAGDAEPCFKEGTS